MNASQSAKAKRRVLFFSETEGYRHDSIPLAKKVVTDLGAKNDFEVDECTDCRKWTTDYLTRYDAMVSFGSGELPLSDTNKSALLAFVSDGKGFVAVHSGIYMLPRSGWPEFAKMVGCVYVNHPWHQNVRIKVEDDKHPATRHLGQVFEITDEIYQFREWSRDRTHVLLSLDPSSVDLTNQLVQRKDADFGLAWFHAYGKGRVFYTALGHREDVWKDPRFHKHLLNGILWVLREVGDH
jgi:type 1 glutamine amidotransferase